MSTLWWLLWVSTLWCLLCGGYSVVATLGVYSGCLLCGTDSYTDSYIDSCADSYTDTNRDTDADTGRDTHTDTHAAWIEWLPVDACGCLG